MQEGRLALQTLSRKKMQIRRVVLRACAFAPGVAPRCAARVCEFDHNLEGGYVRRVGRREP